MDEVGGATPDLSRFNLMYMLTQVIGVVIIILMSCWVGAYLDGLSWTNPAIQFNWHPLLMTIGMIFLYANSILIYRGLRYSRKKNLKLTHAAIHVVTFVLTVIALIAVFDSHNLAEPPIPNLYSLHSLIGLIAVILFGLQWLAGFLSFLVPVLKEPIKQLYMPIHIYFGLLGFGFAAVAALLGISEKAFFSMPFGNPKKIPYSLLPREAIIVNCMGVLIIIFSGLVIYLTTNPKYKRQPSAEDQMLLSSSQTE